MKIPSKVRLSFVTRKPWLLISIVIGFAILVGLIWVVFNYFGNYAERSARPLESALVKAGAIKKCSKGDAGRSPDNIRPWYESYFEVSFDNSHAIELVKGIATENGYNLIHANSANRGPVGVDDRFIDKWFFDNTSKQNPYKDLGDGAIDLEIPVNADGLATVCGGGVRIDSTRSAIGVRVSLPAFRH